MYNKVNIKPDSKIVIKALSHERSLLPSLKISHKNDKQEQEADAVANQVKIKPTSFVADHLLTGNQGAPLIHMSSLPESPDLQMECEECEDEEQIQMQSGTHPLMMASGDDEEDENSTKTPIQPKLQIGEPGDKYEQEADSVADRVMRMNNTDKMQMQPVEEEEEVIQMQPVKEEEESLQMKPAIQKSTSGDQYASNDIRQKLNSTKGSGKALTGEVGAEMRRKMGADFSATKIHTDSLAINMNKELGAQAFTHGNDIFFNQGKYNPGSSGGKRLLAHELTHVVQQNKGNISPKIQKWEASEHIYIGDQTYKPEVIETHLKTLFGDKYKKEDKPSGKVPLKHYKEGVTYSEALALADFFESFDDMVNAPESDIKKTLEIIQNEKKILIDDRNDKSVKTKFSSKEGKILNELDMRFTKATGMRYLEMAKINYSHFSYVEDKTKLNNIQEWERLHKEAAQMLIDSKKDNDFAKAKMAFLKNAFADHFLTDSFSAGHLTGRAPEEEGMRKKIEGMLTSVILEVLTLKEISFPVLGYLLVLPGPLHLTVIFNALVAAGLSGNKDIKSLPFKIIHDLDDKFGRQVKNARGDEWDAYGDRELVTTENKKQNLPRIIEAVNISKNEMVKSALENKKPECKPLELYPKEFKERRWNEMDARKSLFDLVSTKFDMLSILWKEDDIIREYIKRIKPKEIQSISVIGKIRMLNVLLPDFTGNEDEQTILRIFKYSTSADVNTIINKVGLELIEDNFHGKEYIRLLNLIAEKYKTLSFNENKKFIQYLLDIATENPEENAILKVLENLSPGDVETMISSIGFSKFNDNFHGNEYDKLIKLIAGKYRNVGYGKIKDFVQKLLDITTGNVEEQAINTLLDNLKPNDVAKIVEEITFKVLSDNIHGEEYDIFLNILSKKYEKVGYDKKKNLIQYLLNITTGNREEKAIISVIRSLESNNAAKIVKEIGFKKLYDNIHGTEYTQFLSLLVNKHKGVDRIKKADFIQYLLDVDTGNQEEQAINDLLSASQPMIVVDIICQLGFGNLEDNINGDEYDEFIGIITAKMSQIKPDTGKAKLIKHLIASGTTEYEEELIIKILKASSNDSVAAVVKLITVDVLKSNLSGKESSQFNQILINSNVLK